MSYSCIISFKELKDKDVYNFLVEVKNNLMRNMNLIAKDYFIYSPLVKTFDKQFRNINNYNERQICYSWVKDCFSFKYFYWPKYNVLGIYGIPDCCHKMFDTTIHFQNSTDTDYEFSIWDKVAPFNKIADKWKLYSDSTIIKKLELEESDDIAYFRKTACYNEIWKTYLEHTLYNDELCIYFSCFGYYDLLSIKEFLHYCDKYALESGFVDYK